MRIPEDIRRLFFNRAAAVLSVMFVIMAGALLLMPANMPDAAAGLANGQSSYMAEISSAWHRLWARYLNFEVPASEILAYAVFSLLGICSAYLGIGYAVRRKTDSVIKRLFTHSKDK